MAWIYRNWCAETHKRYDNLLRGNLCSAKTIRQDNSSRWQNSISSYGPFTLSGIWLKRIGTELELPVKLTTNVARHSFATIQKNNGLSREYLKESLGHSSIATTERYLSSFEDDDVVKMHGKLLEGIV